MAQALSLKIRGLHTHPNDLSEVPEGALARADNVVINRESVVEPRRGFERLQYAFANANDRANKLHEYQDTLLAHYATDKLAKYNSGSGWTNFSGTYAAPNASTPVRFAEANANLYFTTAAGIRKLDSVSGTPTSAGAPAALDVTVSTTGSSGFMTDNSQVAYRVVWGIRDANNNLILGAPSQRGVVINTSGGTKDVTVTITIPAGITTAHFYQVYRSAMSASSTAEPSDELGLVYEDNPTSGEITAGTLTFTDQTPEDLRGATLYTSPSQQGIAQSNDVPPLAQDITEFRGCLWYANTVSKHRLFLTILSVGGSNGIALDDTLTIAGTTYTAKSVEAASSGHFLLETGGTPAQNIADTALSLVRVINKYASNTSVYARYISGENDLPGKLVIEERGLGGASFSATASARGDAYQPVLPTSGTSVSSKNDTFLNGLYNSKLQEPEAVPLLNYRLVGSAARKILRILPLRDSLFVLKEDGIWRITGDYPNWQLDPLDLTTRIVAPETATVLNNQIYALADQGVVAISDTGVQVVSRPIENSVLELLGGALATVKTKSFAVSYETERKYILFLPTEAADATATQAFVFNVFTNSWTRWPMAKRCGVVRFSDDKLYLGEASVNRVSVERKTLTFRDYADESVAVTIVSASGRDVVLTSVTGLEVGDLLYKDSATYSQIESINVQTNTVTLFDTRTWTAGSAEVLKAIESVVEWVPQTGGNVGVLKRFQEISMVFKNNYFPQAKIGFSTELSGSNEDTLISGVYGGLWGLFQWGNTSWGGIARPRILRTFIPREKSWATMLTTRFTHRMGYSQFQLQGASVQFDWISERTTK